MTHIYIGNIDIIGSDNGLSTGRCQAIIWINPGMLLIGPLGTNFSEILIESCTIQENAFKNIAWKRRPFCLDLSVLSGIDELQLMQEVMINHLKCYTEFLQSRIDIIQKIQPNSCKFHMCILVQNET